MREDSSSSLSATPPTVAALGRLEPQGKVINLAPPSSAVNARVQDIRVQVGNVVQVGEVIAILDSYEERLAQVAEAESQVTKAEAQLQQVEAGAKQGEIAAQEATIARLTAQLKGDLQAQDRQIAQLEEEYNNASQEHERFQALLTEGATSALTADARRTTMIVARERLQEAEDIRHRLATTGDSQIREAQATLERITEVRQVDVAVAQSDVQAARAAQFRSEASLEQTLVRAPVAGQILQIYVQPGEAIAQDGILSLGQTDQMYAIAEVYETDIHRVENGQPAIVTSEYGGFPGELAGIVEQVGLEILSNSLYDPNPSSQSEARIVEVQIRLDPEDSNKVRHLTNLQVRIQISTSPEVGFAD
ncbi:MAG: HlyD family efflux transporter periplasmic adaptor subunit [Prochlorotrichaceae cyanobacterium]